jgi:hypothetical protein
MKTRGTLFIAWGHSGVSLVLLTRMVTIAHHRPSRGSAKNGWVEIIWCSSNGVLRVPARNSHLYCDISTAKPRGFGTFKYGLIVVSKSAKTWFLLSCFIFINLMALVLARCLLRPCVFIKMVA